MISTDWLVPLSTTECTTHLASATLGRVAVIVAGRPEAFPVSYVLDDDACVAFPAHRGTKLASALDWPWVGFEIDGIYPTQNQGWSVLVVGHAEDITDPDVIDVLRQRRHTPWRATGAELWIRIVPDKVTGRRILAGDW